MQLNLPTTDPKKLNAILGPKFYMPLGVALTFFLVLANITVQKIVSLGFVILTIGDFIYPLTYVLDGVITEVYGYALGRRVIWMALGLNIVFALVTWLAILAPHAPFWHNQAAFQLVLGQAARISIASFVAFVSGEFLNSYVIAKLKIVMRGKHLWVRSLSAVAISQAIDTIIFTLIAFLKILTWHHLLILIVSVYFFKMLYQSLALPLIYALAKYLKGKENLDIYDHGTNFNPFVWRL